MKKLTALFLCAGILTLALTGCGSKEEEPAGTDGSNTEAPAEEAAAPDDAEDPEAAGGDLLSGLHHVEIEIEDYGTISLELDADTAPVSVTNFINLAEDGFYDGLTFHRIMEGFMMQGGDPNGDGTGGSDQNIKGEFADNGVENNISHVRGVISMARAMNPDSASSQFFIVHEDSDFLDGQYAAFGHVTEGIEIVDDICTSASPTDNNGTIPPEEQPVIKTIKVID